MYPRNGSAIRLKVRAVGNVGTKLLYSVPSKVVNCISHYDVLRDGTFGLAMEVASDILFRGFFLTTVCLRCRATLNPNRNRSL